MKKQFIILSESWYGPANLEQLDLVEEITISFIPEPEDVESTFQFRVFWKKSDFKSVAKLEVYQDVFPFLHEFQDIILALKGTDYLPPGRFVTLLKKHGYQDVTDRQKRPIVSDKKLEIQSILDDVIFHYTECDITDDERKKVQTAYKELLENFE